MRHQSHDNHTPSRRRSKTAAAWTVIVLACGAETIVAVFLFLFVLTVLMGGRP